jgi:hypothetical protein
MKQILDLETLKPEELVVRVAGREIDISNIPFEIALDVLEQVDELRGKENYTKRELLKIFQGIVINVLHAADESIDETWVRKNVNAFQMMRLIDRIVNPILDGLGMGDTQGNVSGSKKK